mgnify:CR=1 FL=1
MNYAIVLFAFLLLAASCLLTVYNIMYAYRINVAGKKTGIVLPRFIKRLFGITVFLSFGVTLVALVVFLNGL